MAEDKKSRVLVFIVAYNAEKTIREVVFRIPHRLLDTYEVDVLVIDDSSRDATFEKGHFVSKDPDLPFPITVLFNPKNQGYGGNQKLGYHYALQQGYDFVALIHGDGQYAPECLPELLEHCSNLCVKATRRRFSVPVCSRHRARAKVGCPSTNWWATGF
jgi:glycosyltransferase involved in cell wall biosynthesis